MNKEQYEYMTMELNISVMQTNPYLVNIFDTINHKKVNFVFLYHNLNLIKLKCRIKIKKENL